MAYEMNIRGTQDQVKIRSPWAAALLPFITFGIYHLVWWYRINRELRDYGNAKGYDLGQNPTNSVLALVPGFLIIVPPIVSYWRGTKRAMGASRLAGREPLNGWIAIVLYLLLAPALWAYIQVSLNEVWREEAEALPGQELPPPPADQMPPPLEREQPVSEGETTERPPPGAPGQQPPSP
jgi:polyferredoxin